jgi:hypothetical protein
VAAQPIFNKLTSKRFYGHPIPETQQKTDLILVQNSYDLDTKFFIANLIKYAATPPNQPRRCILTDYFNNYNFSKAQIICSLMMVIKPKHVGAVLM